LSNEPLARRKIQRDFRVAYDFRSEVVHGSSSPKSADPAVVQAVTGHLKSSLLKGITDRARQRRTGKDLADWDSLTLGHVSRRRSNTK
jgi:hypothetical protein